MLRLAMFCIVLTAICACSQTRHQAQPTDPSALVTCCAGQPLFVTEASDAQGLKIALFYLDDTANLSRHTELNKMLQHYARGPLSDVQKNLVATIVTKQIIDALKQNEPEIAEADFWHYIKHLHPAVGMVPKTSDIASNALALGLQYQKPEVVKAVFNPILGPKFSVAETTNPLLAFNLACFYARTKQNQELFSATRRALALGKQPAEFLQDTDFSNHLETVEFRQLLLAGGANE